MTRENREFIRKYISNDDTRQLVVKMKILTGYFLYTFLVQLGTHARICTI